MRRLVRKKPNQSLAKATDHQFIRAMPKTNLSWCRRAVSSTLNDLFVEQQQHLFATQRPDADFSMQNTLLVVALIGSASATSLLSLRGGVRRHSSRLECRTRIKQQATTNCPPRFT